MIQVPERLRINIGLGLIVVLNLVMLITSIQQTLHVKRLEQANREFSTSLMMSHAKLTAAVKQHS